jgi:hypothetical protein
MVMVLAVSTLAWFGTPVLSVSRAQAAEAQDVLHGWYGLMLNLIRHTPTYTPPVASRTLGYVGVTAFEAVAGGSDKLQSLAGQLNGLDAVPQRAAGETYDDAVMLQAALAAAMKDFFANTGPTGQRAMAALEKKLRAETTSGVPSDVVARSEAQGAAIAAEIAAWSRNDGGAVVENMGFPMEYELTPGPGHWVPTSTIAQQQFPLLPDWGRNRPFAMPDGAACAAPPPPEYSEAPSSAYYREAMEVYEIKNTITPEQRAIARFWADDAMLSVTPPGHWTSIALAILDRDEVGLDQSVDVLARLGIAQADAFIGCWQAKFVYDTVRPITYIRKVIDPAFETIVNTPPFPEYPSGHSTQSAAAAMVLTSVFGDDFVFNDNTDEADGLEPRSFPSFSAAADEAGISRLYGGIHYRAAIEKGLEQGRCIGAYAVGLKTWR